MLVAVKYWIATYEGTVSVNSHDGEDDEEIIAKAKNLLKQRIGALPFGSQRFEVQRGVTHGSRGEDDD